MEEKKVEPNSGLGGAMTYLLKYWDRLTLFLRQAGAPLDKNPADELAENPSRWMPWNYPHALQPAGSGINSG